MVAMNVTGLKVLRSTGLICNDKKYCINRKEVTSYQNEQDLEHKYKKEKCKNQISAYETLTSDKINNKQITTELRQGQQWSLKENL